MAFWAAILYLLGFPLGALITIAIVMVGIKLLGWLFQVALTLIMGVWYYIPDWGRKIILVFLIIFSAIKIIGFFKFLYNR